MFMDHKKNLITGIGIIFIILIILGIYNNPNTEINLTSQQKIYLESLNEKAQNFINQNERVKLITSEVKDALNDFDNNTFNLKAQQLFIEAQYLQNQLFDICPKVAEGKFVFLNKEKMREVFEILEEICKFRYEYNKKIIKTAKFASEVNFYNKQQMDTLYNFLNELSEMENQLPELHRKLKSVLSAFDKQTVNYLEKYPFLWK